MLGQIFDRRFRIEAKIAAGGFGAIYRVTHLRSGTEFALKVLHPNLTSDPRVVARFQREGAALTRLRDPNTITAYELGEAQDGTLYILMELLRGESLYERFRSQGALPWRPVLALARAVCSSLAEAHALGIIHRDLKPTNIHLEPGEDDVEFVKVLDFGIAKILQGSDFDSSELTHAGQMIGTLDYMSPEQMVGGQCEASCDIYTLGVVMYEMIAGKKPFDDANSAAAALAAVLTETPDRLATRAMVPVDVDRIVMKCLERAHGDRYQTADELAAAIDDVFEGEDQVTSIAPAKAPIPARAGVSLPGASRSGKHAKVVTAVPAANPAAPPAGNLDSTLVGHEPVARLPAGPMKGPAPQAAPANSVAATGSAPMPGMAPPAKLPAPGKPPAARDASGPRPPGVAAGKEPKVAQPTPVSTPQARRAASQIMAAAALEPTLAVSGASVSGSIDAAESGSSLESTQDENTQLHAQLDSTQDDEGPSVTARQPTPPHIVAARRALTPRAGMPVVSELHGLASAQGTPLHTAPRRMTPHGGTPITATPIAALHARATPQIPKLNLREVYPTIHHPPPSPTRPPQTPFDDRPTTGVRPFDMARTMRRDTLMRWIAVIVGLVVAAAAAIWFASHR